LAQAKPPGPAPRARLLLLTGGPRLSAPVCPRALLSLSLSLVAQWDRLVGADLTHVHATSLAVPQVPLASPTDSRSPSLTGGSRLSDLSPPNRPSTTYASPWSPRQRHTPRPRTSPPWPISSRLAPACPPLPSFAHSQPSAPASRRAHAREPDRH
jgi:hypothetical protein